AASPLRLVRSRGLTAMPGACAGTVSAKNTPPASTNAATTHRMHKVIRSPFLERNGMTRLLNLGQIGGLGHHIGPVLAGESSGAAAAISGSRQATLSSIHLHRRASRQTITASPAMIT